MSKHQSWGFYPKISEQEFVTIPHRMANIPKNKAMLPRGLGRSYGDSCLNEDGMLLGTSQLNHYISFNPQSGILRCEAGITFEEILQLIVPKGWFLPVTPGTKFVTVGGAVANDVHGKNHHKAGCFGRHTISFELLRSSGERLVCSRTQNSEFFHATIGGLGLTGLITWVEFKLTKIASSWIDQEQIQFDSLKHFFELSKQSENEFDFTVSWVDCVNYAKDIRGIFIRGNTSSPVIEKADDNFAVHNAKSLKSIPFFLPDFTLNNLSIRLFNELYYHKNSVLPQKSKVHYEPFYYPLDSIKNWNRIYGKRGFLQYQFVVPFENDNGDALQEIFAIIKKSKMGSFLAVLKTFGSIPSEGLLSFAREGVTLALDFPNYGDELFAVLKQCDDIVRSCKGAVYPAKDARMEKEYFESFFPNINEFEKYVDPNFSSSFWRRVR